VVTDDRGARIDARKLDGATQLEIGRGEDCEVRLPDTYVSTYHARIYNRDGAWYIEDLGSTNGTYLNQRKLTTPAELRAGDRVRLGKTTLELKR
jgi:pSer/pThr/pTyr-binding forkhead associated (FHA) protein